ncbi:hypothetical protein QQF64_003173 [Cirrhinus molitorella]|uniref:Uncharacterized protein n=1 Tax=Cirrhinus molitorella TaxID=172907 RepID=A0ABR3MJ92_9TELE
MLEDVGTEEELADEGFVDSGLDPTIGLLDPSSGPSPATTSSAIISTPTSLQTTAGPSISLATTPTSSPSELPAMTPAAPQLAVDERCIPRMDKVDSLAEYLVELRNETGQTLNSQQASTIISLWQNLPYDQQRVAYSAWHQSHLTTGRFRIDRIPCPVARLLPSGLAVIFVKLCNIHKTPKKQGKHALTRWTLILRDYSKIRQLVSGNGAVMQSSTLQLFDVNQTTLIQWHNKRLKRQECNILQQGVNLPASIPDAPVSLPPVQVRPTAAPPQPGPQHQYHLPQSTAGQAVVKRKSAGLAQHTHSLQSVCPSLPVQRQLFPQQTSLPTPATFPTVSSPSPASDPLVYVFLNPQVNASKRIAPAGPLSSPPPARRPYNRKVDKNKCSQCQQPRNKESGHSQYYGSIYCPKNAGISLDQWMEEMRRKRADKK